MTDDVTGGGNEADTTPAAAPPVPPPAMPQDAPPVAAPTPPPAAPPAKKSGRLRTVIAVGAIVVILGVIIYAVRNNVQANDLKVGDCFVIPDGTTVQTVEKHPCTESHNGEVVFVGDYTGDSFPISISLEGFVRDNCVPASETYIGRTLDSEPVLSLGYFSPTRDSWDNGNKSISCYLSLPDEAMTTESFK